MHATLKKVRLCETNAYQVTREGLSCAGSQAFQAAPQPQPPIMYDVCFGRSWPAVLTEKRFCMLLPWSREGTSPQDPGFLPGLRRVSSKLSVVWAIGMLLLAGPLAAADLEARLREIDPELLAARVRLRGDAGRGAVLFHTSAAACNRCHTAASDGTPLGPALAVQRPESGSLSSAAEHVIESLLEPSKKIREGYETAVITTTDGRVVSGLIARESAEELVLRTATDLLAEVTLPRGTIEDISRSPVSMMPTGLVDSLADERDFLDLVRYVAEIANGGQERADALQPPSDAVVIVDDTVGLDHAGIIRDLDDEDVEAGRRIYMGHCVNCHGVDGNEPRLPTARAFGSQPLKHGSDPYAMFLTVSRGAGLMAALRHLSPLERYQVVHFVREELMKDRNPQYEPISDASLASLPEGSHRGEPPEPGPRDYGPVLAAQLGREVNNGLTFRLPGDIAVCYDLHRMRIAAAWQGGFLDLSETHHEKQRGERMPRRDGDPLPGLEAWQWRFAGSFDAVETHKPPRGPLRDDWLRYRGHYLHGDRAILSYEIEGRGVLESIDVLATTAPVTLVHALLIEPGSTSLGLCVGHDATSGGAAADLGDADASGVQILGTAAAAVLGDREGCTWSRDEQGRLILTIPPGDTRRLLAVVRSRIADADEQERFLASVATQARSEIVDLAELTHGGPLRWPQLLSTGVTRGASINGYALDTIALPFENPWNAWLRTSALDFFDDGRCVVTTHGGDVYIVSGSDLVGGLDEPGGSVQWKRFAAGLFEPFGVRVVDGQIYVTCHDGLKRLHDLDGDGEADFIEAFWNDDDVSSVFHSYSFDLQTDSRGNFYLAKAGQHTDHHRPGSIMRIPPEGGSAEVVAWGIRTPNGMGILPDDRLTVSDNQGPWMPASKISLIRKGSFLGNMPINDEQTAWLEARHGGSLPTSFEEPIVWMPQELDSSSGGQLWAGDPRFGPLAGRLLHSSFGKGWLYALSLQEIGDVMQGAIIPLPHQWAAGVMRLRTNPADGQVYGVGLSGWQGPRDGLDGCLQRLRFTGDDVQMVESIQVVPGGLELSFSFDVDPRSATAPDAFAAEMWDYLWSQRYGSDQFSVRTPGEPGHDTLAIEAVELLDARRLRLTMPDLAICDQLWLSIVLRDTTGQLFTDEAHLTIHAIPEPPAAATESVTAGGSPR
jgi:putative heme-binding domain-containing protein